jgi:GTP pyrophosphokinase
MTDTGMLEQAPTAPSDPDSVQALVETIADPSMDRALLTRAATYALEAGALEKHRPRGVQVARTLAKLGVDEPTLLASLLSDPALRETLSNALIEQQFGPLVARLVAGAHRLNTFEGLAGVDPERPGEIDRLRRMLLALTDDVRVVLIKLVYRLERLHVLKYAGFEERRAIARETLEIFAPIANWLGVGQLKWELEDLAFRYLDPQTYKRIVSLLEERREDRERYISEFVTTLRAALAEEGLDAQVLGRPKHIVSIWRKMQQKRLEFHELFDVRAVRVLTNSIADCYGVLGVVHTRWPHIPKEFDDYIANPKENGYQSLHTAVIGPQGKVVEVQIRTREMHAAAEQGIASHWRYKQGNRLDQALERNITQVRRLLEGIGKDEELLHSASQELFSDRVYVFTPTGQIIDLPQGSTPLDFAYAIHTEVGHRCRGAKVNGRIVPLTQRLNTGERVEILTAKEGGPSRDWMNPQLGYLNSANARGKVRAWFNQQDRDQNIHDGRVLFEKGCQRLGLREVKPETLLARAGSKDVEALYADLGRGVITAAQITAWLQELHTPELEALRPSARRKPGKKRDGDAVRVRGVGNLLTHLANCCKPVPGDQIVGFITVGHGVTVHRSDCPNVLSMDEERKRRLIEVDWGDAETATFPVDIHILAFDRTGLLRDITQVLANERINLIGANTHTDQDDQMARLRLSVEIDDIAHLSTLMDRIAQLPNVLEVSRAH